MAKSFKFAASKETNQMDLQIFSEYLAKMLGDSDINVRRFALESLTAVAHVQPSSIRDDASKIL